MASMIGKMLTFISTPVTKKEPCSLMPDVSETYIELILNRMLKDGILRMIGTRNRPRYAPVQEY